MKKFIFPAILALALFSSVNVAQAKTVVELDVVVDTTWTREMSPIIISGSSRNDKTRRVVSGATLTIDPGVEVRFEDGMSLHITSQCLRGYGTEACYRDKEDNIRMPKLIAQGTSLKPIIFTSENGAPRPGIWGSVIIDARNSVVEWAEFRYGGQRSKRAFIEINNSFFENNIIEDGGLADSALFASSQKVTGNVIRNNGGDAIFCDHECKITGNFISENAGDGVEFDIKIPSTFNGNFIYKNKGNAIESASIYSQTVTIKNNFFRENGGGIHIHRSNPDLIIEDNNFLQNAGFAIKSDINNRTGKIYPAPGSWFGIDTGPKSSAGFFFVSADYDASGFVKDGNAFSISGGSKAARTYRDYLSDNNLNEAFFQATVNRKAIIGNESVAGSLLRYSIRLDNQTTSAADAEIKITPPSDQLLLLCSALPATNSFDYNFANACSKTRSSEISFENNQLVWRPKGIPALDEKTLFFVMATRPTIGAAPSLPRLDFNSKPFRYQVGSTIYLKEDGGAAQSTPSSSPTVTTTPTVISPTPAPVSTPTAGGLATGTISRQVINGVLNYVLSTSDGKHYSLYNQWKWRDIDDFTKSADKDKRISIFGEFYVNRYGVTTGIKFTRFEILN